MTILSRVLLIVFCLGSVAGKSHDRTCEWTSKAGGHFDLRPLSLPKNAQKAYVIVDGDIPCTPENEPAFGYTWNFCADVPGTAIPKECNAMGKTGVVLQSATYSESQYYCYIIGHYDPDRHSLQYSLLDPHDPTKGISIKYPAGERCSATNAKPRSASIDVQCANVKSVILSAQEPDLCEYHLVMNSWHGCPTECPVTSHGLCDSHGHCAYDKQRKEAYCYCNEGYSGASCNSKKTDDSYDGFSVQLGLLITLLLLAVGMTGIIVFLSFKVASFRKEQAGSHYKTLAGSEAEMVETNIRFN